MTSRSSRESIDLAYRLNIVTNRHFGGCLDREWPTIPQVYINGEFVGGCDIILGSESSSVGGLSGPF